MASFEIAVEITLNNEKGLVDNPSDPGGLTKFGISQRSYPNLDIRNLTVEDAKAIYLRDFWRFGGINDQQVANKVFDMVVNMGHTAIRLVQKAVGFSQQDGVYGPVTETAINSFAPKTLLPAYKGLLADHYTAIANANPAETKFLHGWLNRAYQ
jgi:lysozyme family protein